jgi:hypothetical protein
MLELTLLCVSEPIVGISLGVAGLVGKFDLAISPHHVLNVEVFIMML